MEKKAVLKSHRLSLLWNILFHNPTHYQIDSLKESAEVNQNISFSQTTRSYILNGFGQWVSQKITIIMISFLRTF